MDFINTNLPYLLAGISVGGQYALIAIGYTMVYGILRLINFAHGDVFMCAGLIMIYAVTWMPLYIAIPFTLLVTVLIGFLIERVAYKPLRTAPRMSVMISAIGVSYLLQNVALYVTGGLAKMYPTIPWISNTVTIGTATTKVVTIITPILTLVLVIALVTFIQKTKIGMAMRAVSKDFETSQLMGIKINNVISATFIIGSFLAAVGSLLYFTNYAAVIPTSGAMPGLKAFVAAVFGGIGSIPGAVIGAFIIGICENIIKGLGWTTFSDAFTFALLIIILIVNIITIALIIAIYAIVFVLEKVIDPNSMLFIVLKKGAIYALVAVSMNLLNGFTGLFSLGQAGFMLIGAYTYAIFTIPVEYRDAVYQYFDGGIVQFSIPVIPALILAGLVAALFAFLIGLPVLRLKSDYLAIATLGFAEIIRAFFQWDTLGPVTNGSNLLRKFPTFDSTLFPFTVAGICILLIVLLINSSYGRAFKAIRDDEIAAEAMGINLFKHKEMSFVISSFFAGVGGALLAMFQTTVQAMAFKSAMTYEILLIVVIGGIGSVTGSVLASFLFIACSEWWLRFLDAETYIGAFKVPLLRAGFRKVVFSIIIMAVVLFYRQGIMGDRELNFDRILRKRQKFIEKTQRGGK